MKFQRVLVTAGCFVYAPSAQASDDQVVLEDTAATLKVPKSVAIIGELSNQYLLSLSL